MNKLITDEWVDWMNAKILQKAVVVDDEGNILVLKRSDKKPGGRQGKWDLLGGSMGLDDLNSDGQLHEAVLAREAREEAGLKIEEIIPICVRSGKKLTKTAGEILIYAVGFKCKAKGVKPPVILSEEHTEFKWISQQELENVDFGENEDGFHVQTSKAYLSSKK